MKKSDKDIPMPQIRSTGSKKTPEIKTVDINTVTPRKELTKGAETQPPSTPAQK